MKRFCFLAALTLLSSSAYAGDQVSFVVAGHQIHIEASRFCRSPSCASISISGIYQSRKRDRFDDDDRAAPEPVKASATVVSTPAAPPAYNPPVRPVVAAAPPAVIKSAAVATQEIVKPPIVTSQVVTPPLPPIQPASIAPPPPPAPPVARPVDAERPPPPAPQVSTVLHEVDGDAATTPVGDWLTEAKGSVRIAPCGRALCGYVLNPSSNDKGEAVLINMKPNPNSKWAGNISSHDSGDLYYGTIEMTAPNTLRVEACALGRFYCSGNAWSRIVDKSDRLIISRQASPEPRS